MNTLQALQALIGKRNLIDSFIADTTTRGDLVALYRKYLDGEHDAKLTSHMKNLLRISSENEEFNLNYCATVIDTMVDRLNVVKINGETDEQTEWASDLMLVNRFDDFQNLVHESALVDGDGFVMVEWDNERNQVVLTHELAYDGVSGVVAVYDRQGRKIDYAIKIWLETDEVGEDLTRVNVYWPDRVEKYMGNSTGSDLMPYVEDGQTSHVLSWLNTSNEPIGVPIIHFPNRGRGSYGNSELKSTIGPQDALNRTLVSMVMTAELSAFQIKAAFGFEPPTALSPGMIVKVPMPDSSGEDQARLLSALRFEVLPQAQLVPFIEQSSFLVSQIATVTRTPIPEIMGSANSSGEALKERQTGLLGKVRRFQVRAGNGWEDVMKMAARVQNAFGTKQVDEDVRWSTQWHTAELRNDKQLVESTMMARELIGDEEALRVLAGVFGYSDRVDEIIQERAGRDDQQRRALANTVPLFTAGRVDQPMVGQVVNGQPVATEVS